MVLPAVRTYRWSWAGPVTGLRCQVTAMPLLSQVEEAQLPVTGRPDLVECLALPRLSLLLRRNV